MGRKKLVKEGKDGKRRVTKFFVTYVGNQKHISLTGIGRVYIGKEFEVTEGQYNSLELDSNFKTRKGWTYIV